MDISAIVPSERIIEIKHPKTENKIGVRISLVSMNDPKVKGIKRRIENEKIKLDQRGKSFTAEKIEENKNLLIFESMTGWEWYSPSGKKEDEATFKGRKPEFTKNDVFEVLNTLSWFGDQIVSALNEETDFFTASETN